MEILWSPWRSEYIGTFKDDSAITNGCFFCNAIDKIDDDKNLLVVARFEYVIAMLNKFPYNNGHTLIAPKRHIGTLVDLDEREMLDIMNGIKLVTKALDIIYHPHGYNIGANLGRAAGAGVPEHLHFHVIPRWNGDTSFTATISDTKVVSVSLVDTQRELSNTLKQLREISI